MDGEARHHREPRWFSWTAFVCSGYVVIHGADEAVEKLFETRLDFGFFSQHPKLQAIFYTVAAVIFWFHWIFTLYENKKSWGVLLVTAVVLAGISYETYKASEAWARTDFPDPCLLNPRLYDPRYYHPNSDLKFHIPSVPVWEECQPFGND